MHSNLAWAFQSIFLNNEVVPIILYIDGYNKAQIDLVVTKALEWPALFKVGLIYFFFF